MYSVIIPDTRILLSDASKAVLPLKPTGKALPWPLLTSGGVLHSLTSLGYQHITPVSASVIIWCPFVFAFLSLFLRVLD